MITVNKILLVFMLWAGLINPSFSQKAKFPKLYSIQSDFMYNSAYSRVEQTICASIKVKNAIMGLGYIYSYDYINSNIKDDVFHFDSNILTRSGLMYSTSYRSPLAKGRWYGVIEGQILASHQAANNHSNNWATNVRVVNNLQLTIGYGIGLEINNHIMLQTTVQRGYSQLWETDYPLLSTWKTRHNSNLNSSRCVKLSLIYRI